MKIAIREATKDDLPALLSLLTQLSPDDPHREDLSDMRVYERAFERINSTPGQHLLVAEEGAHILYTDMADGSAQALKRYPEAFLTDERIMNTSLLSRLAPDVRETALSAIRRDHASGRLQEVIEEYETPSEKYGDGTMFVAMR